MLRDRVRTGDGIVVHDSSQLVDARRLVGAFAASQLTVERLHDLALVTSELVTNALEHGTGEPVDVSIRQTPDGIELTVSSSSLGHVEPTRRRARPDELRGRGLFVVSALSDAVEIDEGAGTVSVTAVFGLP